MTMQTLKQHGVFSWNELMTPNVAAAKRFYSEALGWELQDMGIPDMPYTIAKQGDREVAGIMAIPAEAKNMPPSWGSYVTVDDVDARVERIKSLGGTLCHGPMDIPAIGRMAVISDPQGAILTLITYFTSK
jgi:uncharacterized protein